MKNNCSSVPPHFWLTNQPTQDQLCPNSIYFIKTGSLITMYITDSESVLYPVGSGGANIITITSPDNSITITGNGQSFQLSVSETLQAAINAALVAGDNISELNNDAGYITSTDIENKFVPLIGTDNLFPITGSLVYQNFGDYNFYTNTDGEPLGYVSNIDNETGVQFTTISSNGVDSTSYKNGEINFTQENIIINPSSATSGGLSGTTYFGDNIVPFVGYPQEGYVIPIKGTNVDNPVTGAIIWQQPGSDYSTTMVNNSDEGFYILHTNNNDTTTLKVNSGEVEVDSDRESSRGLIGTRNFMEYADENTYIQKNYVDQAISEIATTNFIKSNESLSGALRKDDTLYGILDQYTGEEVILQKVTGTPTVDTIMYFQLGSEYFKRVYTELVNVKWFGAKGDNSTDDTDAIQATINYTYNQGGGNVYIPKGIYIIGGALKTSDNIGNNPNSQLYIPSNVPLYQGGTGQPISLKIKGEYPPIFVESGFIDSKNNLFNQGVILKSTLPFASTSGTLPSVFGTKGTTDVYGSFNLIDIAFENIWVRTHHDATNGTYLSAFNMLDASFTKFLSCRADTDVSGFNTVAPTGMSIGFAGARSNGGTISEFRNSLACSYTIGFEIGEHSVLDDTNAFFCKYGFDFGKAGHSSTVYHALSQWNQVSVSFSKYNNGYPTSFHFVNNYGMVIENTALGKWYDTTYDLDDPTSGIEGSILFTKTISGGGVNDNTVMIKNGGTKASCQHLTRPISTLEHDGRLFVQRAVQVTRQGDIIGSSSAHAVGLNWSADDVLKGAVVFTDTVYEDFKVTGYNNTAGLFSDYATIGKTRTIFQGTLQMSPATVGGQAATLNQVNAVSDAKVQNSLTASTTIAPSATAVNTALALKANLASPTFTGTPLAPTAATSTNTTQIATTAFVKASTAAQIIIEPTALLTIVPTSKTIMVTYTGTTNTTTLPPIAGNEGAVLFLTNAGSGTATINSDAGGNDIWDSGILSNTTTVTTGVIARLINDGLKWRMI